MRKILPIILAFAALCICMTACKGDASEQPLPEDSRFSELPGLPMIYEYQDGGNGITVKKDSQAVLDQEAYRLDIPAKENGAPVNEIRFGGFAYTSKLVVAKVPGSVEIIGEGAFEGCASLEKVRIERGVKTLVGGTFFGCTALIEVSLPSSLDYMGLAVFNQCSSLTEITFQGTRAQWNAIEKYEDDNFTWYHGSAIRVVHCTDGDIAVGE